MLEKSYAKILNLVCEAPRLWRTQSCVLTYILQRLVLSIDHHQQNPGGASSGLQYRMWNL